VTRVPCHVADCAAAWRAASRLCPPSARNCFCVTPAWVAEGGRGFAWAWEVAVDIMVAVAVIAVVVMIVRVAVAGVVD